MPPPISIILLTLNGGAPLARVLQALYAQTLAGHLDRPPEVLAIDSGSTDDTLAVLKRYPVTFHQIPPQAFGHGRTRNLGARLARGEWLIYLSQDAVPAGPTWLFNLTRHLLQPDVAAAFGRQLPPPDLGPIESFFLEKTYPERAFQHQPAADGRTPIHRVFFSNVNSALKKSVWTQFPFPEDVVMSEDQAFARAALLGGYRIIYDPEAGVQHGHRYTLRQLFRRNFDSGYSLRAITHDTWGEVVRLGLNYIGEEIQYLARRGQWRYVPYALLYEFVKSAGFAAGRQGRRMPAWLIPHLSLHSRHWSGAHE
jgi:rhamnosyltransferase